MATKRKQTEDDKLYKYEFIKADPRRKPKYEREYPFVVRWLNDDGTPYLINGQPCEGRIEYSKLTDELKKKYDRRDNKKRMA